MMIYKIHITKKAKNDMDSSADYIEYTLLNPRAAYNMLINAKEKINGLAFMPQKHGIIDDPILSFRGIRMISVGKYLAFYLIDEDNGTVHIIRFLYGKRDWPRILREEPVDLA